VPYSGESVEVINEVIDMIIDIIYTHWYHDTHQDHRKTTQAVLSAGRYIKNILMYEPEYPAGRLYSGFRNQYYVDITSTFERKMEALKQQNPDDQNKLFVLQKTLLSRCTCNRVKHYVRRVKT